MILRTYLIRVALALAIAQPGAASAKDTKVAERSATSPVALAEKLADWQLARLNDTQHIARVTGETRRPRAWEQAVFWIGLSELADTTQSVKYRAAIMEMGRANEWKPGDRIYFADDHAITQSYLWAVNHGAGGAVKETTRARFDEILAKPAVATLGYYQPPEDFFGNECLKRWCWSDALFMAPPAWAEMTRLTGDDRYLKFALSEFWATTDFLYDPAEQLYYRDSRFFERRDAEGRKLFWSRGNGWVLAGLARLIPRVPPGEDRNRLINLFIEMAGRVKDLQKPDGYWSPSLLDRDDTPPETSGTAFFTYAIAWGINEGLLPETEYRPVVDRGWRALIAALQPDGRLGWVQQVSDRPEQVSATDTQYYGVGAFLMAASEITKLDRERAQ